MSKLDPKGVEAAAVAMTGAPFSSKRSLAKAKAAITAYLSTVSPLSDGDGWQPIETAPLDGTWVDLWMINQEGRSWREPDAYYVTNRSYEKDEWNGQCWNTVDFAERDGWWSPNHDYDGADGWCDEPAFFNPHPKQNKWQFIKPTHWRPLPAPPRDEVAPTPPTVNSGDGTK